jgi:hypothetical protein
LFFYLVGAALPRPHSLSVVFERSTGAAWLIRGIIERSKSHDQANRNSRSYGHAILLSFFFQLATWELCLMEQSPTGEAVVSDGMAFNWRVWFISCSVFWLGFLIVFLSKRERPSLWRVIYAGLAFPVLFVTVAFIVAKKYGIY